MYICKYCGKEFELRRAHNGHIARCVLNPDTQTKYECCYCKQNIVGKISYSRHVNHCELNPDRLMIKRPFSDHDEDGQEYSCSYCGKECKNTNSLKNHERLCRKNPNKDVSNISKHNQQITDGTKTIWNKGLDKTTSLSVKQMADTLKQRYASGELTGNCTGKHIPQDVRDKIAATHRLLDHDQMNKNSHGKRGWLDGMFFMSTWEVAYYLFMRDSGHKITRCPNRFEYVYENKLHTYAPDFLVDDSIIVEVKGYETDLDRLKYTLVPDLVIIDESKISPYLQYVKNTYKTTSIEELYDINLSK